MTTISRRTFIKAGGAGVGVAAIGATLGSIAVAGELAPGGRTVSRTTGGLRRSVASTCLQCPARCGILGFIEEGQMVKIEGNPRDANNQGRICAKGHAGLNQIYNPDRLMYPVRRVGPRGANVWQRVSWDTALQDVAAQLADLRHGGKPDAFIFMAGMLEGSQPIVRRFVRAFGTSQFYDESHLQRGNKEMAQQITWGAPTEVGDVARSRFIVNFGSDPYESHPLYIPIMRRIVDARMRGARMLTLDPRLSTTASRSDEWLPVRPGSDGVIALAMANVILQKGLHDQAFLSRWTNVQPEQLIRHLSAYTLDRAALVSGIPGETIERVAVEFATNKPSTTISGNGVTMQAHGVQAERAIALLNAVAGNIDTPGGYCLPRTFDVPDLDPAPADPGRRPAPGQSARLFADIQQGKQQAGALMTYMANPAYSYPDLELTAAVLKDPKLVPFHVAVDTYVTESSIMADIILPAATYLESWDIQSAPSFEMVPQISLTQPVVAPLGESKPFHDISAELARRIGAGMDKYFDFGSMEAYISGVVAKIPGLSQAGGLKYLKENGVWSDPQARPAYRSYESRGFNTPSGKMEISSKIVEEAGLSALPDFPSLDGKHDEEKLKLITFQFNVHTFGRTAPCMWLSEIAHDNPVWISPERAEALKIHKGDTVRITSELGSITAKAWITQGIHPDVIAMGACVGHWQSGRVAQGKSFQSKDPNTNIIWWEKKGNGAHPYRLMPIEVDPVGGSPAWMGLPVTLTKA